MRYLSLTIACLALLLHCAAGELLFSDGRSDWTIQLGANADPTEQYAAEEFQHIIRKLSGVELPIHASDAAPKPHTVIIGSVATTPAVATAAEALGLDAADPVEELAVHSDGDILYIAGNQPRGALFAVYDFARRELGVRWFWSDGDDGTFFPARDRFEVPELKRNYRPQIPYRGLHLCGRQIDPAFEHWMSRNFIDIMRSHPYDDYNRDQKKHGMHIMYSNHFVNLPREVFDAHPEYFALVNGVRDPAQICWSNPDATRALLAKLTEMIRQGGEQVEIMGFFPDDNQAYCMCPECSKLGRSAAWFDYFNRLCAELKRLYPALKFSTIAYQGYLEAPPAGTGPADVEFLEYCHYDRCFIHRLEDPACPDNVRSLERIRDWQATGVPLGIYGYEFSILARSMSLPLWSEIDDAIRHYRDWGMRSVITEVARGYPENAANDNELHSTRNRFGIYLYAQLLWNPDVPWTDILDDYCRYVYGPAAEPMKQYFLTLDAAWCGQNRHRSDYLAAAGPLAVTMLQDETVRRISDSFREAGELAADAPEPERQRIQRAIAAEEGFFREWQEAKWQEDAGDTLINLPLGATPVEANASAVTLPAFRNAEGNPVADRTEVKMAWTPEELLLTIRCLEPTPERLAAALAAGPDRFWNHDCVEVFLHHPGDIPNSYRHILINPAGLLMDEKCDIPYVGQPSYDSQARCNVTRDADGWTVELALPFAALGRVPQPGEEWRFTVKRSNAAGGNSGWPNGIYHTVDAMGSLYFNAGSDTDKKVYWFNPLAGQQYTILKEHLKKAGWHFNIVKEANQLREVAPENATILLRMNDVAVAAELRPILAQKVREGATLIVSGYGEMPLNQWFDDPELGFDWSGWEVDAKREHRNVAPGKWLTTPHPLDRAMQQMIAPSNGFRPTRPETWHALASVKTVSNGEFPYLLWRPYGRGKLVVTSADCGASGGAAIFGNEQLESVVWLLDNLRQLK